MLSQLLWHLQQSLSRIPFPQKMRLLHAVLSVLTWVAASLAVRATAVVPVFAKADAVTFLPVLQDAVLLIRRPC